MLKAIDKEIEREQDPQYQTYLTEKLTRLSGRSAIIHCGGYTPVELLETRDQIVDCLNSCKSALESGILPGGGNSFIHALPVLEDLKLKNKNFDIGVNVFYNAVMVCCPLTLGKFENSL